MFGERVASTFLVIHCFHILSNSLSTVVEILKDIWIDIVHSSLFLEISRRGEAGIYIKRWSRS